jgi:hypothetical protein
MTFLDKKIKENSGFFDYHSPPEGHQQRFLERLEKSAPVQDDRKDHLITIFKIAAVALIFIAASWMVFKYSFTDLSGAVIQEVIRIEFPSELEETFAYYDQKAEEKLDSIDEVAPNAEEAERVKKMASHQFQRLDAEMAAIEKEYMTNPGNKKLEDALLSHKKLKAGLMESIITQLSLAKQISQSNTNNN